jgi:hypothetical protein
MLIYNLMVRICKYFNISNDEISECYKNKLYNSIKKIRRLKQFFKNHNLDNTKEYLFWKHKLLDEIKN